MLQNRDGDKLLSAGCSLAYLNHVLILVVALLLLEDELL